MDTDDAEDAERQAFSSRLPSTGLPLPALNFGLLRDQRDQRPDSRLQQHSAVPAPDYNKRVHKKAVLRLARLSRLDEGTKAKVGRSVQTSHVRTWLHAHGYVVKADKLHPAVARVIAEWFDLVDDDGSRTLEHCELLAALKAAQIPCDDNTINEMIELMDMNGDGVIGWDEFEVFMTEEFAAGKSLLSGEYLLPSGLAINFGVMIGKLKRDRLLVDVMQDGAARGKWADIATDPALLNRELATMQEAAEATSLTLEHLMRTEEGEGGSATPRTQLTAALLQQMDADRRAVKADDYWRGVREKMQNNSLGPEVRVRGVTSTTDARGFGASLPPRRISSSDSPAFTSDYHPATSAGMYPHAHAQLYTTSASPDPTAPPPASQNGCGNVYGGGGGGAGVNSRAHTPANLMEPLAAMAGNSGIIGGGGSGGWASYPAGGGGPGGFASAVGMPVSRAGTPLGAAAEWCLTNGIGSRCASPAFSGGGCGYGVPGLPLGMAEAAAPPGLSVRAPRGSGATSAAGYFSQVPYASTGGGYDDGALASTSSGFWEGVPFGGGGGGASSSVDLVPAPSVAPPQPLPPHVMAQTACSRNHRSHATRTISTVGQMAEGLRAAGANHFERTATAAAAAAVAGMSQDGSYLSFSGSGAMAARSRSSSPGPYFQPPRSTSRYGNQPTVATTSDGATAGASASGAYHSPPESPDSGVNATGDICSAPFTLVSAGGGGGDAAPRSVGTVPSTSPIPEMSRYTAAPPPPPSYGRFMLPILANPDALNMFVDTAVAAARAEAAAAGDASSSRSGSPAPGGIHPYITTTNHGQAPPQNFNHHQPTYQQPPHPHHQQQQQQRLDPMIQMPEVLEAVLRFRPTTSLDGATVEVEASTLSSPAAPVPLTLRRDLSSGDDVGIVLPYGRGCGGDSFHTNSPYTDRSASPGPSARARVASSAAAQAPAPPAAPATYGGSSSARDAAAMLSEQKAGLRAAFSLNGMRQPPPGASEPAPVPWLNGAGLGTGVGGVAGSARDVASAPHTSLARIAPIPAALAAAGSGSTGGGAEGAERTSCTSTIAICAGPTPLPAPAMPAHRHGKASGSSTCSGGYGLRAGSPGPSLQPSLSGGAAATFDGAVAAQLTVAGTELGATEVVNPVAQAAAAADGMYGSPPSAVSGGGVRALRPTSSLKRTNSASAAASAQLPLGHHLVAHHATSRSPLASASPPTTSTGASAAASTAAIGSRPPLPPASPAPAAASTSMATLVPSPLGGRSSTCTGASSATQPPSAPFSNRMVAALPNYGLAASQDSIRTFSVSSLHAPRASADPRQALPQRTRHHSQRFSSDQGEAYARGSAQCATGAGGGAGAGAGAGAGVGVGAFAAADAEAEADEEVARLMQFGGKGSPPLSPASSSVGIKTAAAAAKAAAAVAVAAAVGEDWPMLLSVGINPDPAANVAVAPAPRDGDGGGDAGGGSSNSSSSSPPADSALMELAAAQWGSVPLSSSPSASPLSATVKRTTQSKARVGGGGAVCGSVSPSPESVSPVRVSSSKPFATGGGAVTISYSCNRPATNTASLGVFVGSSITSSRPASVTGFSVSAGCGSSTLGSRAASVMGTSCSGSVWGMSRPGSRLSGQPVLGGGGAGVGGGSRATSPGPGGQEMRVPTRSRTQMAMRSYEKEDAAHSSWRAAAASQLQLQLQAQMQSQMRFTRQMHGVSVSDPRRVWG